MQPTGWLSKPSVSTMQLVSTWTSPRSNRAIRSARARAGISPVMVSAVMPAARNAPATASACSIVEQKAMVRRSAARRLPVLDHSLVQDLVVEHRRGFGHVEVARGLVDRRQLVTHTEIDGVGARRHQDALLDQAGDRHLEADVAEGPPQATAVAALGRGAQAEELDTVAERARVADDGLVAVSGGAVALVDQQVRDRRHARAPARPGERLHAAEHDLARPVVTLGLDDRARQVGDPSDGGPVLLDQLVGVLQHQKARGRLVRRLLGDVEAGDRGFSRCYRQHQERVAVRSGSLAGGDDRRPLIIAEDHRAPPVSGPRLGRGCRRPGSTAPAGPARQALAAGPPTGVWRRELRGRDPDDPHTDTAAAPRRPEADHGTGGGGDADAEGAPRRDPDQGAGPSAPLAAADRERAGAVDHRPCGAGGRHGRLRLPSPAAHLSRARHCGSDPGRTAAKVAEACGGAREWTSGVGGAATPLVEIAR